MSKKVVVVDDTVEKYNAIRDYFSKYHPSFELSWFRNLRQSQNNLLYFEYDLLVLDMSFERHGATSEDVTFNGLAGLHVLQFLWIESIEVPTIIITTHDKYSDPDFGEIIGLDGLRDHISKNFGDVVVDCISMGPDEHEWHRNLTEAIAKCGILNK